MKSKVRAVKDVETCMHAMDRLQTGANQHAAWVICQDCHLRWALPKPQNVKSLKPQKSTAASSAGEKFSVKEMQEEALKKAAMEVQDMWKAEVQDMWKAEFAQEMGHSPRSNTSPFGSA